MVALNYLVYGLKPAFSRIIPVEIDPRKTVGSLQMKMVEENPEWRTNVSPARLDLYIPKTPITTSSKAEFNNAFNNLSLGMSDGRNSMLEELNPTQKLETYDELSNPAELFLHIIVFLTAGRFR